MFLLSGDEMERISIELKSSLMSPMPPHTPNLVSAAKQM